MCIARTACRTNRLARERVNNGKTLWHSHAVWVALCAQGDSAGSIDTAFGKPLWRPKVCHWNPKRTPRRLQLCKIRPYCGSGSSTMPRAAARTTRAAAATRRANRRARTLLQKASSCPQQQVLAAEQCLPA